MIEKKIFFVRFRITVRGLASPLAILLEISGDQGLKKLESEEVAHGHFGLEWDWAE